MDNCDQEDHTTYWCRRDGNINTLEYNQTGCDYCIPGQDFYEGVNVANNTDEIVFTIYSDCCVFQENTTENFLDLNWVIIYDKGELPAARKLVNVFNKDALINKKYHNITIQMEENENINKTAWEMDMGLVVSDSRFTFRGRKTVDSPNNTIIEYSRSFRVIVDSGSYENFQVNNKMGAYVQLSGNMTYTLVDDIAVSTLKENGTCMFRALADNSIDGVMPQVNTDLYIKMVGVCHRKNQKDGIDYTRYSLCMGIPDEEDCSCEFDVDKFEFKDDKFDCSYMSEVFDLRLQPYQNVWPEKMVWNTFLTQAETVATIPRGMALTLLSDVVMPDYPLYISGRVVFNTIIINRSDVYYRLGNFEAKGVSVSDTFPSNAVLFVGKAESPIGGIQSIECVNNPNLLRYMKTGSPLNCDCDYDQQSGGFVQSDCSVDSRSKGSAFDLRLTTDYEVLNEDTVYWHTITVTKEVETMSITGGNIISSFCNFTNVINTITLNGTLKCTKLRIRNTTRIIGVDDSRLSVDTLTLDCVSSKTDDEPIISMASGRFDLTGEVDVQGLGQDECVELASSIKHPFSESLYSKTNDISVIPLSTLLRVCKGKEMKDISCIATGSGRIEYSKGDYDHKYCPCRGSQCTVTFPESVTEVSFDSTDADDTTLRISGDMKFTDATKLGRLRLSEDSEDLVQVEVNGGGLVTIDDVLSKNIQITNYAPLRISASNKMSHVVKNDIIFCAPVTNIERLTEDEDNATHSITVSSTVTELSIDSITAIGNRQGSLFSLEESSTPLIVNFKEATPGNVDRIIFTRKNRNVTIANRELHCDGQAYIITSSETVSEADIELCQKLGITENYCEMVTGSDYIDETGAPSYSCPCNSNGGRCTTVLQEDTDEYTVKVSGTIKLRSEGTIKADEKAFVLDMKYLSKTSHVTIDGTGNMISVRGLPGQVIQLRSDNVLVVSPSEKGYGLSLQSEMQKCSLSDKRLYSITLLSSETCPIFNVTDTPYCLYSKKIETDHCQEYSKNGSCTVCEEEYALLYSKDSESVSIRCTSISISNCKRAVTSDDKSNNLTCIKCNDGYHTVNGKCEKQEHGTLMNNIYVKCDKGYCRDQEKCVESNDTHCIECHMKDNEQICDVCDTTQNYIPVKGKCTPNNHSTSVNSQGATSCDSGYYINGTDCKQCKDEFGDGCTECTADGCINCKYAIHDGHCRNVTDCTDYSNNRCTNCIGTATFYNITTGKCDYCTSGCTNCIDSTHCLECEPTGFWLINGFCQTRNSSGIHEEYLTRDCNMDNNGICYRCNEGKYIDPTNNICNACDKTTSKCMTCINEATNCLSCVGSRKLSNNKCEYILECTKTIKTTNGDMCVKCKTGWSFNGTGCNKCSNNCLDCLTSGQCIECKKGYSLLGAGVCKSNEELGPKCYNLTDHGCITCREQFYSEQGDCIPCRTSISNCETCESQQKCTGCMDGYLFIENLCIHYTEIKHCTKASNSKCSKCEFWYSPSNDGLSCEKTPVGWFIALMVIIAVLIVVVIIVAIIVTGTLIIHHNLQFSVPESVHMFTMSESDIKFMPLGDTLLVVDKNVIHFDTDTDDVCIPVGKETKDTFYIGNKSKGRTKVHFTFKDDEDMKYYIRVTPDIINLAPGKACKFEIFITPYCTCKISDMIQVVTLDYKSGITVIESIGIATETQMSTRLDFDELAMDKQIGEGSFGVVFKGMFRNNLVAIKLMKIQNDDEAMDEFEREVAMLDKFRNQYIVHFYGAVFIPNKVCMVTEFAEFGSLQDLMNQRPKPIKHSIRLKYILDMAKGIQYLHSNGIMHRDIKADNFLVFSMNEHLTVDCKLTDFGSSRNINLLKSNMTFTKGVGTPMYMAPEVLAQERYTTKADVFSFAIVMYQCYGWCAPYPKDKFPFPWDIAEFVTSGKRLPMKPKMESWMYQIIGNCWKANPNERYNIDQCIADLEKHTLVNITH